MSNDTDYLRSYGPQLISIATTLFASYFTLTTLLTITSQRELLIAIFVAIWVYVKFARSLITDVFFYEESADYLRLVIQVSNEDRKRKARKEKKELDRGMTMYQFPKSMFIDENNDVVISVDIDAKGSGIVYLNKRDPVKQALLQLCDFLTGVVILVLFSILINVYLSLLDLVVLYWYNYIIVFSIPGYLIFVFFVFKQY